MLRLLVKKSGISVRKNKTAVIALDNPQLSARVACQPRVPDWIDVASPNLPAYFELRVR